MIRSEINLTVLEMVVHSRPKYLKTPERVLLELLADSAEAVPLNDRFFDTLSAIEDYRYLPEILGEWADRKRANAPSVSREELAAAIRKIDLTIIREYGIEELETLLQPLFELADDRRLPAEDISVFFLDKGAESLARHLLDPGRVTLSLESTLDVIERLMQDKVEEPATLTQEPEQQYSNFLAELRQAGVQLTPASVISEAEIASYPIAMEEAATADDLVEPIPEEVIQPTEVASEKSGTPDDSMKFTPPSQVARQATELFPMERYIAADMRHKFIKKLFDGNEESYERSIALLNKAENWKQAAVYLDAIYLRNKIKPDRKQALKLSDATYERFRNRAQAG